MKIRFRLTLALLLLFAGSAGAQVLLPSPQTVNAADSGTACVTVPAACATWSIGSAPSVTFQVTGTMTSMTLTFEATADGQTWFSIMPIKQSTGVSATTTTATGQFSISNPGYLKVRTRCTTYASGAANLTLTRGTALSARAYNIGTLGTTNGGTGFASYAVGDLLSADTTTSLSKVPAVATGQVLASAGANTLPAYTATPSVTSLTVKGGTGTGTMKTGGVICQNLSITDAATQNVNNYVTCAIPANTLHTNGDSLAVHINWLLAANGNTKGYQFHYALGSATCGGGPVPLCNSGCSISGSLGSAGSASTSDIQFEIVQLAAGSQRAIGSNSLGAAGLTGLQAACAIDETLATQIAFGVYNATASAASVQNAIVSVSYRPAP